MKISISENSVERRRDPRMNRQYSLNNLLRHSCSRLGVSQMVIADSHGRVLAQFGDLHEARNLAKIPTEDPIFSPAKFQNAFYDETTYLNRISNPDSAKVWPFRYSQGVGYVVCDSPTSADSLVHELENVCAGFRRISVF